MVSTRPRVTFVIDDLGHGGAQRQLNFIAGAISGQVDVHVAVMSANVEPYARRLREQGIDVNAIPRRQPFEPGRLRALIALLRSTNTQIVHPFLEASNVYGFVAGRALRIPVVLSLRDSRLIFTGVRARALSWMYRRADAVTANSAAGRDCLVGEVGVRGERVVLLPNIVPVASSPPSALAPHELIVGCVGRLAAQKRFEAVIEAMPAVRNAYPHARLEIVGEGPCRDRLESAARRVGGVDFVGAVDEPAPRMARFTCLVIASLHEGVANVALEALALGVPVVTVAVGDLARVVTDNVTGVIARDGSPVSLADAIVRAIASPDLRASTAREGPRFLRSHFSEEVARERLLELYDRVLGRAGKRSGAITGG